MQETEVVNTDAGLQKKTTGYKRIYLSLMWIGAIMLASVITYAYLSFSTPKKIFQPLGPELSIGSKLAVDSSGKLIVFPIYNNKDSTVAIMVSSDSGQHFEQLGGPWKNREDFIAPDFIYAFAIAPDPGIIAIGSHYIYLKAAKQDSFSCINTREHAGPSKLKLRSC